MSFSPNETGLKMRNSKQRKHSCWELGWITSKIEMLAQSNQSCLHLGEVDSNSKCLIIAKMYSERTKFYHDHEILMKQNNSIKVDCNRKQNHWLTDWQADRQMIQKGKVHLFNNKQLQVEYTSNCIYSMTQLPVHWYWHQ